MIFTTKSLKTKVKKSNDPIASFLNNTNKIQNFSREIDFTRYIGMDSTETEYINMIKKIDDYFLLNNPKIPYLRVDHLDTIHDPDIVKEYTKIYDMWDSVSQGKPEEVLKFRFPFSFQNDTSEWTQKKAFSKTVEMYKKCTLNASESMARNFGIKLMSWMPIYIKLIFSESASEQEFPKIVFVGNIKIQEFLFLYFLSLLGCDILYMNSERDIDTTSVELKNISVLYECKNLQKCSLQIPDCQKRKDNFKDSVQQVNPPIQNIVTLSPSVSNPNFFDNRGKSNINFNRPNKNGSSNNNQSNSSSVANKELSYEELAKLSASIVMIKVYNNKLDHYKSGSGVVIGDSGYILTNFHVVCGGHGYAVQFENEEQVYTTQELIKYHDGNDLAIIRVDRNCKAISLFSGNNIVRGQRIVAIGSPLGLFNTISDGIVSGFRKIQEKSMIQFTAPISNGSSGGALLDMYGRLVGIITAGYDEGQNLNLAVDCETIRSFASNFISRNS